MACFVCKSTGTLILAVPDRDGMLRHKQHLLDLPPHHFTRWSARQMRALAERFSLQVVRLASEPLQKYNVQSFLDGRFRKKGLVRRTAGALLRTPLRRWCRGHTLYAAFKTPSVFCRHSSRV